MRSKVITFLGASILFGCLFLCLGLQVLLDGFPESTSRAISTVSGKIDEIKVSPTPEPTSTSTPDTTAMAVQTQVPTTAPTTVSDEELPSSEGEDNGGSPVWDALEKLVDSLKKLLFRLD